MKAMIAARRKRALGLALIALAVPFPAFAISGGGSAPASLTVTASLDHCGLAESQIICKIDAGWNSVEGADDYAVSVTGADGSVVDYGRTTGQGTSVWVPYSGPGTYSVQITAWGTPPDEDEDGDREVLARSSSMSGEIDDSVREAPASKQAPGEGRDVAESEEATDDPVEPEGGMPGDPMPEAPSCDEETSEPDPDPKPMSAAAADADAEDDAAAESQEPDPDEDGCDD